MQEKEHSETELPKNKQPSRFIISLIWGVLAFIVLAAAFEVFSRSSLAEKIFPLRSVGDYHTQFEIKWFKLEEYVQQNGGVDVILLGNSMVNTGIDADTLSARYEELTGQKMRVFNFGVEGLTVAPLSKIAKILEDQYHPGTIVLVTDIRDYSALNGLDTEEQFLDNDWLKFQLGANSFKGMVVNSSSAVQRLMVYRNWSSFSFMNDLHTEKARNLLTTSSGYEADTQHSADIDAYPNPNDPQEKAIYEMFSNYTMDPGRIKDLQSIIALDQPETQVFVTGFPVYRTYYAYFSDAARQDFDKNIVSIVENAGGIYIPVMDSNLIPFKGRADNHHLNDQGAEVFSKLFAEELAAQCKTNGHCLQSSIEMGGAK
jgi:hypothetical protein